MRAKLFNITAAIILTVGSVTLMGCNQASDRRMGASNQPDESRRTGTAAVRGSETQTNPNNVTNTNNRMSYSDQMQQCKNMMQRRLGSADNQYDQRFIDTMIPHHQAAVQMAKDAQQKAQHPELKKLAQNIIDSQQKEIQKLQNWRKDWYGSNQAASNQ